MNRGNSFSTADFLEPFRPVFPGEYLIVLSPSVNDTGGPSVREIAGRKFLVQEELGLSTDEKNDRARARAEGLFASVLGFAEQLGNDVESRISVRYDKERYTHSISFSYTTL